MKSHREWTVITQWFHLWEDSFWAWVASRSRGTLYSLILSINRHLYNFTNTVNSQEFQVFSPPEKHRSVRI